MRNIRTLLISLPLLFLSIIVNAQGFPWWTQRLFVNTERDTAMNLFKVDSAHYNHPYSTYNIGKRYIVNTSDERGYMTSAEQWETDENTNDWILNKRYSTTYYANGVIQEFKQEYWNPDSLDWVLCEKQIQRNNGQIEEYVSKHWSTYPPACGGSKDLYYYNDFDSVEVQEKYSWGIYIAYRKQNRWQFFYNAEHKRERKIYQDGDNDEWKNITLIDYYYEGDNCTEWLIYKWMSGINTWELYEKRVMVYDEYDNLLQYTYYYLQNDSSWKPASRYTRNYNPFDLIIEQSHSLWDTVSQDWEMDDFRTWSYINDTLLESMASYYWRADTGIWWNGRKNKFIYDEFFNLNQVIYFDGWWNHWDTSEYYIMEYDEIQRNTLFANYDWVPYHELDWEEIYFWDQTVDIPSYCEPIGQSAINIYPNPTCDDFTIKIPDEFHNSNIRIFNHVGILVWDQQIINKKEIKLTLAQAPGIYFVKITNHNSTISGKLILLNR